MIWETRGQGPHPSHEKRDVNFSSTSTQRGASVCFSFFGALLNIPGAARASSRSCYKQARSQRLPSRGRAEEIQGGRNFWKQVLTDNFIVTQNNCKRVCFVLRRNAETQSRLMPRCVSSRMLGELDLPTAPLSLTVAVDGQCLGLLC